MTWYGASIITTIIVKEGTQDVFPVFEDVYLIEAENREFAYEKAKNLGLQIQNADDTLQFNGIPAKCEFLGIRKLRSIYNGAETGDVDTSPPVSGAEITHSYFEISNKEDLKKFAEGKRINVDYLDDDE